MPLSQASNHGDRRSYLIQYQDYIVTEETLEQNKALGTLEKISEVRIKRHSLPVGLVNRMKGSVKP